MKKMILIWFFIAIVAINLYGQTESKYFRYKKSETVTSIYPQNEVNHVLAKGRGLVEYRLMPADVRNRLWNLRVRPFQEMIDDGIFSPERMRELEKKNDQTTIEIYFDETGVISYVSFYYRNIDRLFLTEEELRQISRKYKSVKFDMSDTVVSFPDGATGSPNSYYSFDGFKIPFKELRY